MKTEWHPDNTHENKIKVKAEGEKVIRSDEGV